mgnify:FL=1|jgi:hypothetical protein|tara:strand:+ start:1572 stop:2777 length:1206 start_codon:yes stop_codon:yes gene_type:complete
MADETLFTDILTRLRPGFKVGGEVKETYTQLKKKLGRNPTLQEIRSKGNFSYKGVKNNLGNLKLSEGRTAASAVGSKVASEAAEKKRIETNKLLKPEVEKRYKYPKKSVEAEKNKVLTNSELAKKYKLSNTKIERAVARIKKEGKSEYKQKPASELNKEKIARRRTAQKKYSVPALEQKYRGNKKVHLGHAGDLYNVPVTATSLKYTPAKINLLIEKTIDPAIKAIIVSQNRLAKNKPKGYKKMIENYNIKGLKYASFAKGYKVFPSLDPNTLKRGPGIVDYSKAVDTLGLTKNKPLKKLTKQDKAFIEINRKNVLESQKKVTPKEVNKILKFIKKATKAGPSGQAMASGSSTRQAGIREINPMRYPVVPKYKQGGFTSYFNGGIVAVKGVNKLTGKRYGR